MCLRICDFGLARGVNNDDEYDLTEYVVTRWYRAPEIMLLCTNYNDAVDIWSVGCIMAELFGRTPLFPGEDQLDQMNQIFDILGTPNEEDLNFVTNIDAKNFILNQKSRNKVNFNNLYPNADKNGIDLLQKMLQFNPEKRITVQQALNHPYFYKWRQKSGEKVSTTTFNFDFETLDLSQKNMLQKLFWHEIIDFRPELIHEQPTFLSNPSQPSEEEEEQPLKYNDDEEGIEGQ